MQFTKNFKRFRLVTFDITDTLLKFKDDPGKIYAKTASQFGYQNVNEKVLGNCFRQQFKIMSRNYPNFGCQSHHNITWQTWWIELVKKTFYCSDQNIDDKNLHKLAEHLLKIFRTKECWKRIDCGDKLIQKIRESGPIVGCISNFDPSLRDVLEEMNILQHFDFVLTSYDANVQKPEKEIFNLALKRAGKDGNDVESCEALHIGNSFELDFIGAQNAGWSSLLVTQDAIKVTDVKEDFVYENICDMLKTLETKDIKW